MKWAVNLVFAYGHFNIALGVSEYICINILTHDPGGDQERLTLILCAWVL